MIIELPGLNSGCTLKILKKLSISMQGNKTLFTFFFNDTLSLDKEKGNFTFFLLKKLSLKKMKEYPL